jgi:hypothetical protein
MISIKSGESLINMDELNKRLDIISAKIDRAESKFERRMDRLEDKIDERMINMEKDVSSFKKFTFMLFIGLHASAEYIKGKLGL